MTAPTHTAVKILSNFVTNQNIQDKHISVTTATIHSILGLYVKTYKGKQVLRKRHELAGALYVYDVVVIDEGSMIGEDIWVHLKDALKSYQGIVIFMADIAQLKPVEQGGSNYSPIFSVIKNKHTLEVSRRTAIDNPAFDLICRYREAALNSKMLLTVNSNLTPDYKGYLHSDKDLWYKLLVSNTKEATKSGDLTYVKAIAYTNNRVNDINTFVRGQIYGYNAPQFMDGEYVVAGSIILNSDGNIIINNNAEFRVNILREDICHMTNLPVYWVESSLSSIPLKVINFHALAAKDNYFKELRKKCMTTPSLWDQYSEEYNSFADIRYLHAYTAHKCQGATFKYVFIDQYNLSTIKDPTDRASAAYVAVSRATDRIHFY
jgi:ATP-dependent exoDNAse (exonuclease V) alpha subunit